MGICRGGSASRPYHTISINHAFVGAATVPTAPTVYFFTKKFKLPTRAPPNHPVTSKIHDQVSWQT